MTEPRDELLERYAEAVAQDPRRPSERVRHAARAHAQMLRDQAAEVKRMEGTATPKTAANQPQWTYSLVASLAVVGLAGLLYVQIDRGAPEDREIALGAPIPSQAPAPLSPPNPSPSERMDSAQVSPKQQPAPAAHTRQRQNEKAVAEAATAAATARAAVPPAANQPVQDAAQTMANVATSRAHSAPPVEVDASPAKVTSKATGHVASTESLRDAKSEVTMAPAAPTPAAPAFAAAAPPPPPAAPRHAREMAAGIVAKAPFLDAVRSGHTETVQKLLTQGVAINARDENGNTALMVAVAHRHTPLVRMLLDRGADPALVNQEGLTALRLASQMGLADMVQLLQTSR